MIPPHEVRDEQKLEEIKESLKQNGWQGSPLVIWGDDDLLTGSHRYAAAVDLGWSDSEIPTIDLEDVFAEGGLDFDELHEIFDYPTLDEITGSGMLDELPKSIIKKYGIQW